MEDSYKETISSVSNRNKKRLTGIYYVKDSIQTNIDNSLNVNGNTSLNNLTVKEKSYFNEIDISGHLNVFDDVCLNAFVDISDGLNVIGITNLSTLITSDDVSLNSNVDISGYLNVGGNVSLNSIVDISTLNVSGITSLSSELFVVGDVSLNNDLYVNGSSRFIGTVTIDGSLNVNESSYTYTKTTINSINLDVSDNIIKINVKDISTNQTSNLPSGIMVQDISTNVFFGYSGRKDGQEHEDKFVITKTTYDESVQSDISLSFDKSVDVFLNGSLDVSGGINVASTLDVSGNVKIDGSLEVYSTIGFAYQVVGETNDLSEGEYPFSYGAAAYDQDISFGYPILIQSNLVKVGLMLSDASMASNDASINKVIFTISNGINSEDIEYLWEDLSGYCQKYTNVYPIKITNITFTEGQMVNIKCKTLELNNFPSRYDIIAVEKARIVLKFLTNA